MVVGIFIDYMVYSNQYKVFVINYSFKELFIVKIICIDS